MPLRWKYYQVTLFCTNKEKITDWPGFCQVFVDIPSLPSHLRVRPHVGYTLRGFYDQKQCITMYIINGLKRISVWTQYEILLTNISTIPVQRSTNWANKPTGSWSMCWIQINHQVMNDDFRYRKFIYLHCGEEMTWVQIPYGPEIFFRSYFQLLVSVVFLAARIS